MNNPSRTIRNDMRKGRAGRLQSIVRDDHGLDLLGPTEWVPPADQDNYRDRVLRSVHDDRADAFSLLDDMCRSVNDLSALPEAYFHVLTRLLDRGIAESVARGLIQEVHEQATPSDSLEPSRLWNLLAKQLQSSIHVAGAIPIQRGVQRVVAMIGPTGVGKTTTIAKLAGNMRLRERHRVGLITVDTYRIAAVDQLKTYAEIIDLPMEVVATPREMREAVARLSDQDIVFVDTAGRSPQNDVQIRELNVMLTEARTDEVHLVLSSVASSANLSNIARRFRRVGVSSVILTKLDESDSMCELIPFLREEQLPLSYTTNGQCVPDDIQVAQRSSIVSGLLGETSF